MNLEWVRTYEKDLDYVESIGGVMWGNAGMPPRWHICHAQTRAWLHGHYVERCNCGGYRGSPRGLWIRRNETRKDRRRDKRIAKLPLITVTCGNCGQPYEAHQGTHKAREQLCTRCWGDRLIASAGTP